MDDQKIVDLLFHRNESALAEVDAKYTHLYKGILRRVLRDEQDVEECANDVLMGLWNSIPPNRPQYMTAYICKIARRVGIDKLRYNTRLRRNPEYQVMLSELEDCWPDTQSFPDDFSSQEIQAVLSDFIRSLEPQTKVLFVRRYIYLETIPELANRFDLRENYISVRLHRVRKKLQTFLSKEGIYI